VTERKAVTLLPADKEVAASLKRYEAAAAASGGNMATSTTGAHP